MTKNIEIFQTGIISRIFQIFRSHGRLGRTVILITLGLLLSIAGLILYSRNTNRLLSNDELITEVKIFITEEGMYQITAEELASVGMNIHEVDPRYLHLTLRGVPQSLFIVQEATISIEFYGQVSDSFYSSANIYILRLDTVVSEDTVIIEKTIQFETKPIIDPQTPYIENIFLENNLLYFPQVMTDDHWFWASLSGSQTQSIPLSISNLVEGDGIFKIGLWGLTQDQASPDHHLLVKINGMNIMDVSWDGKGAQIFDGTIPARYLVEGENEILIEVPGDTQASAEIILLNWVEVSFSSLPTTQTDRITFIASELPLLLRGLTGDIQIFDITDNTHPGLNFRGQADSVGVGFIGADGHSYTAVGSEGFLKVDSISPLVTFPDLRTDTRIADYVAIGSEDLIEPIQQLLDFRSAEGLQVLAIPLQTIYDQYNEGFPEPEAIHNYLHDIYLRWQPVPRYVLLVGDASYDPRNYLAQEVTNRLPTYFIDTQYGGQTASDLPFVQMDDDKLPDIAIGRIPASTNEEVSIIVQKILNYERLRSDESLGGKILAISDGQDPAFAVDAQNFLNVFAEGFQTNLYAPAAGATDGSVVISGLLNEGYSLVGYFGHGGVLLWGKDRLLTAEEATNLSNQIQPIVINMTCLTGLFTHPKSESITEALLFNPNGGAVAILAPTSLTLPSDQSFLSIPLARELLGGSGERLGDLLVNAQQQITADQSGIQDVLNTFLLFGDPALVWP
jgi:hypothetical protein